MKKFLSLVLALVMVTSLFAMTTTAGAADFTDDDGIKYQEAIDVISAIKVVDGYSDGSFKPTQVLTRGAAAKIICNLILGPSVAAELNVTAAPFKDVPASHTFAAPISYCAQQGIINGYGDETFKADGTLTGYAFLKMLLGALGYDGEIEKFTGPNWTINVAKLADGIGLTADVADDFSGTAAVNRETACLFAFNTIKADLVEYDNRITANVGGVDVTLGGSNTAKSVTWDSQTTTGNTNIVNDRIVQFGERYFSRLVRNSGRFSWEDSYINDNNIDDLGRPATNWSYRGENIGTYAETPAKTYTGSVKVYQIYNDLGMNTSTNSDDHGTGVMIINGIPYTKNTWDGEKKEASGVVRVSRTNTDSLAGLSEGYEYNVHGTRNGTRDKDTAKVGDGTIVEVFRNEKTNDVIIACISVYGGKVASVKSGTGTRDDYVEIEWGDETLENFPANIGDSNNNIFETTGFEEDDVVAYTYSDSDESIQSMSKIESVQGTLSRKTWTKSMTLGETTYGFAKEYTFETGLKEGDLSNNSQYVVYLDSTGKALWIEEDEFSVKDYAVIRRISAEVGKYGLSDALEKGVSAGAVYSGPGGTAGNLGSVWDGNRAQLLFADGTTRTVYLDKSYASPASGAAEEDNSGHKLDFHAGDIVRTRTTASGDYRLSSISKTDSANFQAKTTQLKIDNKALSVGSGSTWTANGKNIAADSNTTFIALVGNEWKVYTGIKNAPTVKNSSGIGDGVAYAYVKGSTAKIVFIMDGTIRNTSKDVTFLALQSVTKENREADSNNYYVYNAVVRGEITTVAILSDIAASKVNTQGDSFTVGSKDGGGVNGKVWGAIFNSSETDGDDIITEMDYDDSDVKVYSGEGIKKVSTSEVRVDTKNSDRVMPVAASVKVYQVTKGGDIESIEMSKVATSQKVVVFYTVDDGEITNLFIVETTDRD